MNLKNRISAFSLLGKILRDEMDGKSSAYSSQLNQMIETQHLKNPWFTADNVRMAITAIAVQLTQERLEEWTSRYPELNHDRKPLKVGVIMAGNIPLAGFHDFLSVLISGNNILAKTSSKDSELIQYIGQILFDINPEFSGKIEFTNDTLKGFDSVIATGSDNSSRYFEYYFRKYPNIIRKNRSSIAVLEGNESQQELEALGTDIFSYFGLGCRNVSKLFIPVSFDLSEMIKTWSRFSGLISHSKYANNYNFSKAVYLVNKERVTDTGYVLIKEDPGLTSPVAVLYLQYYNSMEQVSKAIDENRVKIQCTTGHGFIPFGKAQSPVLWDYADGIDTLSFLLKKK